jgi:predicted membrane channel-forming protein YqfA (hemolysin III family)
MKIVARVLLVVGFLFLIVGASFYYLDWPDLWNGLITGPIVIALSLVITFFSNKILKKK